MRYRNERGTAGERRARETPDDAQTRERDPVAAGSLTETIRVAVVAVVAGWMPCLLLEGSAVSLVVVPVMVRHLEMDRRFGLGLGSQSAYKLLCQQCTRPRRR